MVFGSYATNAAGEKIVAVGYFPFTQKTLEATREYICLERNP